MKEEAHKLCLNFPPKLDSFQNLTMAWIYEQIIKFHLHRITAALDSWGIFHENFS